MEKYFISGIDTNIGKSVAVGWFARLQSARGKSVVTQKLIQTGCEGISEDIITHRKIMGRVLLECDKNFTTCKYVLKYPASPHLACAMENVELDFDSINANTEKLLKNYDVVIVEGAGGLLVPLSKKFLTADYVKRYRLPLILVVSSRLGSLNHALLSLEVAKCRGMELAGIIYNTYPQSPSEIESSTREYLKEYIAANFPDAAFYEMGHVEF